MCNLKRIPTFRCSASASKASMLSLSGMSLWSGGSGPMTGWTWWCFQFSGEKHCSKYGLCWDWSSLTVWNMSCIQCISLYTYVYIYLHIHALIDLCISILRPTTTQDCEAVSRRGCILENSGAVTSCERLSVFNVIPSGNLKVCYRKWPIYSDL